jgi:thiol-disulfide isomerase/thioredoxin
MMNKENLIRAALAVALTTVFAAAASAQAVAATPATAEKAAATAIKVQQIDIDGLRKVLKPNGRPLLINFWATWCPPCVDEFPDLVKMDAEYRGRVDFVTVSLDELSDINTYVPKFLEDMKSEMPAYLLHTPNESAAIAIVSRDWAGSLPMTVVYDASGKQVYAKMGKIRPEILRENIRKLLPAEEVKAVPATPAE